MATTDRDDWPYDDDLDLVAPPDSEPTWECPEGTCACDTLEDTEPLELTILLCDERARPIPCARCRVLFEDRVLNHDAPNADADGWLSVVVRRPIRVVTLEWAPPDTPLEPPYPYRLRYHVDLALDDDRTASKRRLHNLGFRHPQLKENVKAFQRAFDYEAITGNLDDIRADLVLFHDQGWIPEIDADPDAEENDEPAEGTPSPAIPFPAFALDKEASKTKEPKKGKGKGKKPPTPRNAPPKQHPPAGDPQGIGTGTARPPETGTLTLTLCSWFSLPPAKRCRWDGKTSHPVRGAIIELFDGDMQPVPAFVAANGTPTTGKAGVVKLKIGSLPDGEYVLKLNPPEGHALRDVPLGPITTDRATLLRPAGPDDKHIGDASKHTRFRFLEVRLRIERGALKDAAVPEGIRHKEAIVAHGAVLESTESALTIDWKPDWVQCRFADKLKKDQLRPHPDGRRELFSKAHFIILHHTGADTPGSTINQFTDEKNTDETGAHYLVDLDGHVIKMAHEDVAIKHAGECFWHGLDSFAGSPMERGGFSWNHISVGIEQVHVDTLDYNSYQVAGTKNLIERIRDPSAFKTSQHNVLGHGEIALHRKKNKPKRLGRKLFCPGAPYPWPYLERTGNASQPAASASVPHARYHNQFQNNPGAVIDGSSSRAVIGGLQLTLSELGYFVSPTLQFDEVTKRAVEAFHNRYFSGERRPPISPGSPVKSEKRTVDIETIEMMHKVITARGGFLF